MAHNAPGFVIAAPRGRSPSRRHVAQRPPQTPKWSDRRALAFVVTASVLLWAGLIGGTVQIVSHWG